jgi:prepilin-type N-terminal cleavage/methylation domain-containing protein
MFLRTKVRSGFTLIELLLVIAIVSILAALVFLAVNPTRQLGEARDEQRRNDVKTIMDAVYQYSIDHGGNLPTSIPTNLPTEVCKDSVPPASCTAGVNLRMLSGTYIVTIPADPKNATSTGTWYYIQKDTSGRITVSAPGTEREVTISVTQ